MLDAIGQFRDGIRWGELQVKAECGFGHCDPIEFYPADGDKVNVANMRYLWILPERHPLVWRPREQRDKGTA